MALIWRITPLKSQLSVSSIRCTTLVQMSSPIRTLWIYIDVTISAEQAMLYLVYVERWLLWVTKLSWFKLGRLLQCCTWISVPLTAIASSRTEHNFVLEILCTSAPLRQLLKLFEYALSPFRHCNLSNASKHCIGQWIGQC